MPHCAKPSRKSKRYLRRSKPSSWNANGRPRWRCRITITITTVGSTSTSTTVEGGGTNGVDISRLVVAVEALLDPVVTRTTISILCRMAREDRTIEVARGTPPANMEEEAVEINQISKEITNSIVTARCLPTMTRSNMDVELTSRVETMLAAIAKEEATAITTVEGAMTTLTYATHTTMTVAIVDKVETNSSVRSLDHLLSQPLPQVDVVAKTSAKIVINAADAAEAESEALTEKADLQTAAASRRTSSALRIALRKAVEIAEEQAIKARAIKTPRSHRVASKREASRR